MSQQVTIRLTDGRTGNSSNFYAAARDVMLVAPELFTSWESPDDFAIEQDEGDDNATQHVAINGRRIGVVVE